MKINIFFGFTVLFFFSRLSLAQGFSQERDFYDVATGGYSVCTLDGEAVRCWTFSSKGSGWPVLGDELKVPSMNHPRKISGTDDNMCALDDQGLKCWNIRDGKQIPIPTGLRDIKLFNVGYGLICALDAEKVKCWDFEGKLMESTPSDLKGVSQIAAGEDHACALHSEGLSCWGNYSQGQINIPDYVKHPVRVAAGYKLSCVEEPNMGIVCWGQDNFINSSTSLTENIVQFSLYGGANHGTRICILDKENYVSCGVDFLGMTGKKTIAVSAGGERHCRIREEGFDCWNKYNRFSYENNFYFQLKTYDAYLAPVKKLWFTSILSAYLEINKSAGWFAERWFAYTLFEDVAKSVDSEIFKQELLKVFDRDFSKLNQTLKYKNRTERLLKTPDNGMTRKMALGAIHGSLNVMAEFLNGEDFKNTQEALRLLGGAQASPMNDKKVKDLLSKIDSMKKEKSLMDQNIKTKFIVQNLDLATKWLGQKVK